VGRNILRCRVLFGWLHEDFERFAGSDASAVAIVMINPAVTASTLPACPLQAGVASIEITPRAGTIMQGYDIRCARSVADATFASALVAGSKRIAWLLLTVDVIGLDRSFTARVRRLIARRLQVRPSQIMITCSHTHSGPATLARIGPVTADTGYLALLAERLAAVAEMAAARLEPVVWRFGTTLLGENVNRRLQVGDSVALAINPLGPVDRRLRVVRIDRAVAADHARPLALLVHYACHATTSGAGLEISADWPGAMRTHLKGFYSKEDGDPCVHFLQGCAGNLTHQIGKDRERWPEHVGQATTVQSQALGRVAGDASIEASENSIELTSVTVQAAVQSVSLPFHNRFGSEKTEIQVVRMGPERHTPDSAQQSIWFIGLPGEPFTEYSMEFGSAFQRHFGASPDRVLVCGYTNDCVGYLCTPQALVEKGYESAVAHRIYDRPAPFSSKVQAVLLERTLGVAQNLLEEPREQPFSFRESLKRVVAKL
jgi:neutral ceramidase